MRTFMTALVPLGIMAVATATFAADDVQDLRLRVHRLSPSGAQAAVLTGRTTPSAASRPTTATLTVGTTTAVLSGKISRAGRLHLLGRRLALAEALATFDRVAVELSGGVTTSVLFAAEDCLRLQRGRLLDCAGRIGTVGPLVDGVYDLAIGANVPSAANGVARLTTAGDGTRSLRLRPSALDFATLTMASDFTLSGYHVLGGDAFIAVTGAAQDESTDTVSRLSGSYAATSTLAFNQAFLMQRPAGGTPTALGGTWTLALVGFGPSDLHGTMSLALAVAADGTATTTATTIERDGGGTAYTVRAGTCDVGPSGGLHCDLGIDSPPSGYGIAIQGVLEGAGGPGQGTFAIGPPPILAAQGTWSATR